MASLDEASADIQRLATKLSNLTEEMYEARINEDGEMVLGVGLQYDVALKEEMVAIYTDAMENERKLPAEGIREAIAWTAVKTKNPKLWIDYHNKSREIDGIKLWISNNKAAISANQSVLRGERE